MLNVYFLPSIMSKLFIRNIQAFIAKKIFTAVLFINLILLFQNTYGDTIPLRLHPENNHYFEFRGEPTVLITSAEHYGAVLNLDFDYVQYLDELQTRGLNYARIFTGTFVSTNEKSALTPDSARFISPWARSNTPGYRKGGNKFDLDTWDTNYFNRLNDFVSEAGTRGVVVEITLFCVFYDNQRWWDSPMYYKNNINDVGRLDISQPLTMDNGILLSYQKAMVTKIVQELQGHDNIFYEICNEPYLFGPDPNDPELSTKFVHMDWQREIVDAINTAQANFEHKYLIAQNIDQVSTTITQNEGKLTDAIDSVSIFNLHYNARNDWRINTSIGNNYHLNKPIGCDETGNNPGVSDDESYRKQAWNFIMAGGTIYNNLDFTFQTFQPDGLRDNPEQNFGGGVDLRNQLGILSSFFNSFDFIHMDFHNDLPKADGIITACNPTTTKVRCMSKSNEDYAVYIYSEEDGPTDISFNLPAGHYLATWVDVKLGTVINEQYFEHYGGALTLTAPVFTEDIALKLSANKAPYTDAGIDIEITLPENTVQLNGVVSDDGLPLNQSVVKTWSIASGPNAVTFSDPGIENPTATFARDGVYVLKFKADDSELFSEDFITVKVNPGADLIAYWNFDEETGTVANDLSANANNGSLVNGFNFDTYSEESWHNRALRFDQAQHYVRVPHTANTVLDMGEDNFSISLHMYWDSLWSDKMYLVNKTDVAKGYAIRMDVQNTVSALFLHNTNVTCKSVNAPMVDTWNNIVVVFDRTGKQMRLYLNGVLEGTAAIPEFGSINNPADLLIGAYNHPISPRQFFNGSIDELRIYDRVLTQSEISTLWNSTRYNLAPVVEAGADKVLFLPSTDLLMEGVVSDDGLPENGSVTHLWEKVSGEGHAIFSDASALNTNVTFSVPGEYILRLTASDGLLSSYDTLKIEVFPQTDLLGHWALDETGGTFASDNSSLDNIGILKGGMNFNDNSVPGYYGGALSFDGVDDYITLGDPADGSLDMGENDFSISSWFFIPQHVSTRRTIVNKSHGGLNGYALRVNNNNRMIADFRTDYSNITCFTDQYVTENEWHYAVVVFDRVAGLLSMYLDGALIGSKEIGPGSVDNDFEFRIGANASGAVANKFFNGILDEVKLFNRALSAAEVSDLFNPAAHFGLNETVDGDDEAVGSDNETELLSGTDEDFIENGLALYPNPFSESTHVEFTIKKSGFTSLKVYNSVGQEIETLFEGLATSGDKYKFTYEPNNQRKGFYYLILEYEGSGRMVKKIFFTD